MLENKVIITNESNKNKIYEKSKNKWIIELDGSKINNWDDFYKIIQKEIDILNYDETKRVMVMADRDRIKQVFINILDNALKFTDEGGVVLTDIKIEEDKAIIEVIDNGCGISEDEISLVTGKFYKGTNSNSHTGLGLSICEEIVKAHNGNLIIRSVLEKGTVVRVELPLEKGDIQNEA